MDRTGDEETLRYQTRVALPLLDIPASAWLRVRPCATVEPGDVVFGRVYGSVTVGTVDRGSDGHLVIRDGASGEVLSIRRAEDLRSFGVVVGVATDFA